MSDIGICRGIAGQSRIALTYDDGPIFPEATRSIVDSLEQCGARATFFVRGCMAVANQEVVKRIHGAGMELGNHTFNHPPLSLFKPEDNWSASMIREEITRTHSVVQDLTGYSMRHFRAPWGRLNDFVTTTMDTDPELRALNYRRVRWSIDTEDYKEGRDANAIIQSVLDAPDLDGAIVLMHDGADRHYKRRAEPTVEATKRLVPLLISRGFTLVNLSDILEGASA